MAQMALGGGGWSAPRPGRFTPGKDPVPIVQKAGWAPGPVWMCAKNLAHSGIRSPDRPARSQSLYRLSYPAHTTSSIHGNGNHIFITRMHCLFLSYPYLSHSSCDL
jgi:hypothetical protein